MSSKIFFTACIALLIAAQLIGSTSNAYYFFDLSKNGTLTIDKGIIQDNAVVFEVETDRIVDSCRYSSENKPFSSMEGFFDENYGKIHKKIFENLEDKLYKFYVKCEDNDSENPVLEAIFSINKPISARISISEDSPLKAGKYEINLVTSKLPSNEPSLSYSYDGVVYHPIPLFGDGKNWKGYLIIPEKLGDAIISFKFSAKDSNGNTGNEILGKSVFIIDTQAPQPVTTISHESYEGQIKLKWYYNGEDVERFNIYRSDKSGVDYIDYYDSTDKNYFTDNSVEKGKTYYYKVAPVDKAGNIGELSREVKATALIENSSKKAGLSPELAGEVDSFIVEINSIIGSANEIKKNLQSKENEYSIFNKLKLGKEIEGGLNELNALKRDANNYKLQDLNEVELENKLNSARTRLNIIKKKLPENLIIKESKTYSNKITENDIRRILLEYNESFSEEDLKDYIEESKKLIEKFDAKNRMYLIEIIYLDGTSDEISFFESDIHSEFSPNASSVLMLEVPKEIAESADEINMLNLNYNILNKDPLFGFNIDSEEINYYIEKQISKDLLQEIVLAPIQKPAIKKSIITGNFLVKIKEKDALGAVILAIAILALSGYFVYIKRKNSENVLEILEKIDKIKEELKKGEVETAVRMHNSLKKQYSELPAHSKKIVYRKIKSLEEEL